MNLFIQCGRFAKDFRSDISKQNTTPIASLKNISPRDSNLLFPAVSLGNINIIDKKHESSHTISKYNPAMVKFKVIVKYYHTCSFTFLSSNGIIFVRKSIPIVGRKGFSVKLSSAMSNDV